VPAFSLVATYGNLSVPGARRDALVEPTSIVSRQIFAEGEKGRTG
jgi:hypothetical protein